MTSLTRLLSFLLLLLALAPPAQAVLPRRLLLLIDRVAYRDVVALQQGVSVAGPNGKPVYRQAFTNGYFPASRLVSTFTSTSDIAWTEMLGNTPLPGYQRTYYSRAANASVRQNGVTSTMPYEQQMTWQEQNGFRRASAYVATLQTFR